MFGSGIGMFGTGYCLRLKDVRASFSTLAELSIRLNRSFTLGGVLQRHKEHALDKLEFSQLHSSVEKLVQLVVDYSLAGFRTDQPRANGEHTNDVSKRRNPSTRKRKARPDTRMKRPPCVPGSTDAERFDNALRKIFTVFKGDLLKEEGRIKTARARARKRKAKSRS